MPSQSPVGEQCDQRATLKPHSTNPFATKFIRAGAIEYRFPKDDSLLLLRDRLARAKWRGQIIGPHGSGKSTLLATLNNHWKSWDRNPSALCLRNRQRTLPTEFWDAVRGPNTDTLIIDGFEQLGFLSKSLVLTTCVLRRLGLILTLHHVPHRWQPNLNSTVFLTQTSTELTRELAAGLLDRSSHSIDSGIRRKVLEQLPKHLAQHGGNVRETFLSLYDIAAQ